MTHASREAKRAQAISPKFDHLTQLVYCTSGTAAAIGLAASILFSNAGMAITGMGTAGLSLYVLAPSRERASQTAATLLIQNDDTWERQIADVATQVQAQMRALANERETLRGDRLNLSQTLSAVQASLTQKLAESQAHLSDRQHQIEALKTAMSRLQRDQRAMEQPCQVNSNMHRKPSNRHRTL